MLWSLKWQYAQKDVSLWIPLIYALEQTKTKCSGFSWDKVSFLPSSRCNVLFWIQHENNVDNTLVFWLLLSSACSQQRTSQCQWGAARKAVREHGQGRWSELAKGVFHTLELHTQYINWGNYPEQGWLCFGDTNLRLGISHQVVSNCIVHLFDFINLSCSCSSFSFSSSSILFQVLNCSYGNPQVLPFFPLILLSIPVRVGG